MKNAMCRSPWQTSDWFVRDLTVENDCLGLELDELFVRVK